MNDPANPVTLRDEQIRAALALIVDGMKQTEVAKQIGVTTRTLRDWMQKYPDLVQELHAGVKARATLERPQNFKALVKIRDSSKNHSARVKSVAVLEAMAGAVIKKDEGVPTIVIIGGEQVNVGAMRATELDELLKKAASRSGPQTEKVIDAVLAGRSPGNDRPGDTGGSAGPDAAAPADPPGPTP